MPGSMMLRAAVAGALAGAALGAPAASAADPPTSVVDDRAYPGAEQIFAERGVRVIKGDGNIRYAPDCAADPDLLRVEQLVGSELRTTCFDVRGPRGFLTLELPNAFLVRGADRPVTARSTFEGETETVTVPPYAYEPIGNGNATHTLVELRVAGTLAAGEPSAFPFVARVEPADGSACSGVLVAAQWIATTKSCLDPDGDLASGAPPQAATVTLGRADLTRSGGHTTTIAEVVPRTDRDLVLARLAAPAEGITPIGLASAAPAAGDQVVAAGYGRGAADWTADVLRRGDFTAGATNGATFTLTRSAGTATSTCKGDAGGPAFRSAAGSYQLLGLHSRSTHAGCFGNGDGEDQAIEVRTDDLGPWISSVLTPPARQNPLKNLLAGATPIASSSTENWGWALRQVNDGTRDGIGWSTLDPPNAQRAEWLQFDLPQPQMMNRLDLFPRSDGNYAGQNFPSAITVETYRDGAWSTALQRSGIANPGNRAVRYAFDAPRTVEKLRISLGVGRLFQFAEVEAYLSDNLLADATVTASSTIENWGWTLRAVNDVRREGIGWSSDPVAGRNEWLQFDLPRARMMNRIDLYPRSDGSNAGNSFPASFSVEAYRDGQWRTVLTQSNRPHPGAAPQRFQFPPQLVERLRVSTGSGLHVQFAEVEAYLSNNLLADAVTTAASSTENWGWSLRYVNDGVSGADGWSSLDPPAADRVEWVEFAFPGPRTLNRVDLYPRTSGSTFPADFTIDVFRNGTWHTVVSRTGFPAPGVTPQRFLFPAQDAERVRVKAGAGRLLQFAEVTADLI
ncbi:discoidin domain-containing protein [Actinoplanes sp. NPDC026670]|uniref:discoidin domain-containing protein n=1 Tax=Actinoplanes sp. NPDC026670 TaxID=3154700 RepID=UPI0033F0AE1D